MRQDPRRLHRQRAQLDVRLVKVRKSIELATTPRSGWIKAIRESLGMSAEQLGARIGISKQAVLKLERNELRRTVSLSTLERAAQAIGCKFVYGLIPDESLEHQVEKRARLVAQRKLARVGHSMALEDQKPPPELHELQVTELAKELKDKLSPELWIDP